MLSLSRGALRALAPCGQGSFLIQRWLINPCQVVVRTCGDGFPAIIMSLLLQSGRSFLALTVRGFFCKRSKQYKALMLTQPRGRSFAERHDVVKMALRTNSTRSLNHRSASSSIIENIDMLLEAGHHIVEEFTLLRFVKHLGFRKPLPSAEGVGHGSFAMNVALCSRKSASCGFTKRPMASSIPRSQLRHNMCC